MDHDVDMETLEGSVFPTNAERSSKFALRANINEVSVTEYMVGQSIALVEVVPGKPNDDSSAPLDTGKEMLLSSRFYSAITRD